MLAATEAGKVTASAGNSPATSDEVGATSTTCAVLAEAYQETTRCDSVDPTVRTTPERVAGSSALAADTAPVPSTAVRPRTAALAPKATRRRTGPEACTHSFNFIEF